jgi:hypothetical protein
VKLADLPPLGVWEDGTPRRLLRTSADGGGTCFWCGRTRSGKSWDLSLCLAALVHCDDAVCPFIADVEKLCQDFDHDDSLPVAHKDQGFGFDRLGIRLLSTVEQIDEELDLLLTVKDRRAARKLTRRFLICPVIDEVASYMAGSETEARIARASASKQAAALIITGEDRLARIARGAAGVGIVMWLGAQRATATGGFLPASVRANIATINCFTTQDRAEGRYLFGDDFKHETHTLPLQSGRGWGKAPDHLQPMRFQAAKTTRPDLFEIVGRGLQQPTLQQIADGWDGWDDPVVDPFTRTGTARPAPAGCVWLTPDGPVEIPGATDQPESGTNTRARRGCEFTPNCTLGDEICTPSCTPNCTPPDDEVLVCVLAVLASTDVPQTASQIGTACADRESGRKSTRQIEYAIKRGLDAGWIVQTGCKRWGKREIPLYRMAEQMVETFGRTA